ncbi:Steroid 17-alpha-hydroxylase/17,20 lyase [Mycena sanguinolenta]|uniref:Steroid 17-alpha-hydroxylase/17,20 lyase n=1 Tax=Mycena sanguinolenta TaxID=230812 RepID=A0A8H6ZH80_9AGAR|nr:Steroid 17-alpha-hydroxylase/17,20 lyase [Mycena sanguinolenta]
MQPVFLIGDIRLAKEILEKRSNKFSSRPTFPYVRDHVDPAQGYWGFSKQHESHFIGRKLTTGLMAAVRAGETEPLQQFEALLNMIHLLDDGGKNWFNHMDRVSASMVLTVAFGLHCPTGQEPDLKEVIAANYARRIWRGFRWAAAFAREDKPEGDQRRLMNMFTTTAVSLHIFILACILYPEWISHAQREIDAIVGEDRLPSFKDRPHLPYVEAIVRETLRWRPALRFGGPHQSTADDTVEYKGRQYFIPKGSMIFAVTWAIEHEQERFQNHDVFQPERFLDDTNSLKADYETSAFGFGRRGKLLHQALSLK